MLQPHAPKQLAVTSTVLLVLALMVSTLLTALAPRVARAEPPKLPRSEVVAAYYLGFAAGPTSLHSRANDRAAAGPGIAFGLSLGLAFWHELPLNVGFGQLRMADHEPFSEFVVTCSSYGNTSLGCSDPKAQKSEVTGSYVTVDGGYQPRIQLSASAALLPGALVGYLWNSGFKRGVECEGCSSIPIQGVRAAGTYVAPALRFVFTREQFLALSVRSQWFVNGDLQHMTMLGFEFLAP